MRAIFEREAGFNFAENATSSRLSPLVQVYNLSIRRKMN